MKNIDLHVTQCCIALLAVAMTRSQNGIIENLASVAYLTWVAVETRNTNDLGRSW